MHGGFFNNNSGKIEIITPSLLAFIAYSDQLTNPERENIKLIFGSNMDEVKNKHYTFIMNPEGYFDFHEKDEKTGFYDTIFAGKFKPKDYMENMVKYLFEKVQDVKNPIYSNYRVGIIKDKDNLLRLMEKTCKIKNRTQSISILNLFNFMPEIEEFIEIIPFSNVESTLEFGFLINQKNDNIERFLFKVENEFYMLKPLDWILWLIKTHQMKLNTCNQCNKRYPSYYTKCPNRH